MSYIVRTKPQDVPIWPHDGKQRPVVDHKTRQPLTLFNGDGFTIIGYDPEQDVLLARLERAPTGLRKLVRRFFMWTLRL